MVVVLDGDVLRSPAAFDPITRHLISLLGGINRSSAALCAWLIFRHGLTTQEAVRSLLTARPTLCPWTHQPHVLWALHTWEKNQDQVIRPRILAEVQQMSVSTPGPA